MSGNPQSRHGRSGEGRAASIDSATAATPSGVDLQIALRAARTGCTVLITGETGVGKGHLARWLHENSPRAHGPFVPVNCGAIPDTVIDSHLFGHARGAFTGAASDHAGMVRAAEGGTLLLDEVSELPPTAQVRLLRLLQEHEVQPVGVSRPVMVDARVVAATNTDLATAVTQRRFREDLLYRLDIVRLHVSPLRERVGDIPRLLDLFNGEFAGVHHRDPLAFEPEALGMLRRSRWPGNVRQVRTVVERLHVLCPNTLVSVEDLRRYGGLDEHGCSKRPSSVDQVRLNHVREVVRESDGSISQAADALRIHRSTLYRWLRDDGSDANT